MSHILSCGAGHQISACSESAHRQPSPAPSPGIYLTALSSPLHFALCGPSLPPTHLQGVPYRLPPLQLTGVSSSCSWGAVGKRLSQSWGGTEPLCPSLCSRHGSRAGTIAIVNTLFSPTAASSLLEEPQSPQPPRLACSWSGNCSLTPGRGPKASSPKSRRDPLPFHSPGKPLEEE